jgi:hypothetical protein
MNRTHKARKQLLLISLSSALLMACTTQHADTLDAQAHSSAAYTPGVPGGVISKVLTIVAKVSNIDYSKRSVTLEDAQGHKRTLQISPEASNFEQVKVGDQVTVKFVEEMAVAMADAQAPAEDSGAALVAKAAEGEKPAILLADTRELTAVVKAVDLAQHSATLEFADGSSRTVAVRPDVALSSDAVGRHVLIRISNAMALAVTPQ